MKAASAPGTGGVKDVFAGGGEMGALMRSMDWSRTKLGPVASWPTSLRTMVGVLLGSRFPKALCWGPELLGLYNDGYRPILGDKHPASLGQPFGEVWSEIWHILGPLADGVLAGGQATWNEHLLLPMYRKGFVEETYFTFSYSPVPDDDGRVGGMLITCQETTEQVQDDRQLRMLRDLGARASDARTAEEACTTAAGILAANDADLPFTLFYLVSGDQARLVCTSGMDAYQGPGMPALVSLRADAPPGVWPLGDVVRTGREVVVSGLGPMPTGRWEEPPQRAVVLPLARPGQASPYGLLVAGVSPRRELDSRYLGLFRLTADQITTAIASARAYEEARARAEALAELDRAKTAFFSNVSHEFRTPLTLILGPLEDALARPAKCLEGASLETAYRNALRLLRLVNALLDFSRIEAGRLQARYEPTDLAAVTAELASVFRAAVERAGLELVVRCEPLAEPVHVDRDLYEKIVFNLLSNALKFTFEGRIEVGLRGRGDRVELTVRDTGVGIPAEELPRLFERFHRIEGIAARTHEGSGIGLALVQELVRMHGGDISVDSAPGRGSTFAILLRSGTAHLPAERIVAPRAETPVAARAAAYVEEALRWLPDEPQPATRSPGMTVAGDADVRILVADDNADMRDYLARLLRQRWSVDTVANGEEALRALRRGRFDLILTDVMMPIIDGFSLLRSVKSDPALRSIPVLMLSARAGEESRIEGLEAGADDYLVKPFAARELMARVDTHLQLARTRAGLESARGEAEAASRAKDEFLAMLGHELRNPLAPILTSLQLLRLRGIDYREHDIIERQVGQLTRLVDDLMDISRITRGRVELRLQHVEMADAVVRALEQVSPLLEHRQQRVEVSVPRQGLGLRADPGRLAQVIANLLTNASKYSEPGSLIRISAARDGATVRLRVIDEGIGITPDMLGRVFDLFYQQPQSLERAKGGLGLGLAIVRTLVEAHGGTVVARSDGPGKGSVFEVTLPRAELPVAEAAHAERPAHPLPAGRRATGKRVLIVDDNEDAAEALGEALEHLGYVVAIAHDGPAALQAAAAFDPQIALVDIGLPVMDGYELAQRLREVRGSARDLHLIAVTGYGQEADQQRSAAAGFQRHLVKPVDLSTLEREVGAWAPR